jgi:hypothetical protein
MKRILFAVLLLGSQTALAADLAAQTVKAPAIVPAACPSAGACSGWFASFGIGAQSNSGSPNILAGGVNSAFSDGLDIFAGGGYQLWSGQWLAGIELTGGYEFTNGGTKPAGGNFVGTEFVKLGYNFLATSAAAPPTSAQNPFLGLVPANFLANSTPSIIMGGVQRHGLSVAAVGAEIDTVIAAGWSSYAQLYNSPSQQGLPDDTTLRIGLQKHF